MIEELIATLMKRVREREVRLSVLLTYRTWKSQLMLQVLDLKNWCRIGTKYASSRTVALL
jgi:hypothetical protein